MPKRVVDGDSLWSSDKLQQIEPESFRRELANLIPLALANGSFECEPRKIWQKVYAYNRPATTPAMVSALLNELERVGILFRWKTPDGKTWGYWIGVNKPGRLPPPSDRKKGERLGAEPPQVLLQKFVASLASTYPGIDSSESGSRPESEGGQRAVEEGMPVKIGDPLVRIEKEIEDWLSIHHPEILPYLQGKEPEGPHTIGSMAWVSMTSFLDGPAVTKILATNIDWPKVLKAESPGDALLWAVDHVIRFRPTRDLLVDFHGFDTKQELVDYQRRIREVSDEAPEILACRARGRWWARPLQLGDIETLLPDVDWSKPPITRLRRFFREIGVFDELDEQPELVDLFLAEAEKAGVDAVFNLTIYEHAGEETEQQRNAWEMDHLDTDPCDFSGYLENFRYLLEHGHTRVQEVVVVDTWELPVTNMPPSTIPVHLAPEEH
jgi:hypothetical protein